MLQKIESINLLQLAKNINHIIYEGKLQLNTEEYEIEIEKSNNVTDLQPLLKLLSLMVKDSYLVTEIYFENKDDFEKCFNIKYDDSLSFDGVKKIWIRAVSNLLYPIEYIAL